MSRDQVRRAADRLYRAAHPDRPQLAVRRRPPWLLSYSFINEPFTDAGTRAWLPASAEPPSGHRRIARSLRSASVSVPLNLAVLKRLVAMVANGSHRRTLSSPPMPIACRRSPGSCSAQQFLSLAVGLIGQSRFDARPSAAPRCRIFAWRLARRDPDLRPRPRVRRRRADARRPRRDGVMAIAVKLDDLLHERRMTLTELAEKIDITLANLSILKTGKARAIRFSTLEAICAVPALPARRPARISTRCPTRPNSRAPPNPGDIPMVSAALSPSLPATADDELSLFRLYLLRAIYSADRPRRRIAGRARPVRP